MFGPKVSSTSSDSLDSAHIPSSQVDRLEKRVGLATSAQDLVNAVDELWEATPSSQHSALVGKVTQAMCNEWAGTPCDSGWGE